MPKGVLYALKTLWYILRVAVVIGMAVALFALAFFTAMDAANAYIIATDGMKRRADAVITGDAGAELIEYFTPEFLEKDVLLLSLPYTDYTIKAYDHKASVKWITAWPWRDEAVITVVESVSSIDGVLALEKQTGEEGEDLRPPEWESFEYEVHLLRNEEGRYYINELRKMARAEETDATPAPTIGPDTTLTPRPTPTPTLLIDGP